MFGGWSFLAARFLPCKPSTNNASCHISLDRGFDPLSERSCGNGDVCPCGASHLLHEAYAMKGVRISIVLRSACVVLAFSSCDGAKCQIDSDCGRENACAQDPPNSECHSGARSWSNCPTVCRKRCEDAGACAPRQACTLRIAVWSIGENYDKVTVFDAGVCSPFP